MAEISNELLDAGIAYAAMGLPVFPCAPKTKKPITAHGFKDASTDPDQVRRWWTDEPNANIGMPTGAPSGTVIVDVDPRHNGEESIEELQAAYGELPDTPESHTGGGGRHIVFAHPGGHVPCSQSKVAPGVDIKGDGGYVVLPPSLHPSGETYIWEASSDIADVPLAPCPPWLVALATAQTPTSNATDTPDGGTIPSGQRNAALARLAGGMRRMGMTEPAIRIALLQTNQERCSPPLDETEVRQIARSIARYEPDQTSMFVAEGQWQQMTSAQEAKPLSVRELVETHPDLRPPLIHGLLRQGETMNVISAPKVGKSWLVTGLALSVATGRLWLDTFQTEQGNVLIIDNELHGETSANRIPRVAKAMGIGFEEYADRVFVQNLRGQLKDLFSLGDYFKSFERGWFKLVILDAFYRFLPIRSDENDNGTMASLYNYLDSFADLLHCSFVLIHHTSKGNQSAKAITDVGAGAGAQSRATDTHLVLRKHEESDAVVLDAAVRSWAPTDPFCLQWTFPVWTPAPDLDPTALQQASKKRSSAPQVTPADIVQVFNGEPMTRQQVIEAVRETTGASRQAARKAVQNGLARGDLAITEEKRKGVRPQVLVIPRDMQEEG